MFVCDKQLWRGVKGQNMWSPEQTLMTSACVGDRLERHGASGG